MPELVLSLDYSQEDIAVEDKANEVKEELDRTVRFYNSSHESSPIPADMPVIFGEPAG